MKFFGNEIGLRKSKLIGFYCEGKFYRSARIQLVSMEDIMKDHNQSWNPFIFILFLFLIVAEPLDEVLVEFRYYLEIMRLFPMALLRWHTI